MSKMLAENAKVAEQVTVPEEVWLINRLQSVDGIKDIVPVTKDNDPNGMLNKEDGYVSCVYFSYDKVDNSSVPGENVIDKGTDCVEQLKSMEHCRPLKIEFHTLQDLTIQYYTLVHMPL